MNAHCNSKAIYKTDCFAAKRSLSVTVYLLYLHRESHLPPKTSPTSPISLLCDDEMATSQFKQERETQTFLAHVHQGLLSLLMFSVNFYAIIILLFSQCLPSRLAQ